MFALCYYRSHTANGLRKRWTDLRLFFDELVQCRVAHSVRGANLVSYTLDHDDQQTILISALHGYYRLSRQCTVDKLLNERR